MPIVEVPPFLHRFVWFKRSQRPHRLHRIPDHFLIRYVPFESNRVLINSSHRLEGSELVMSSRSARGESMPETVHPVIVIGYIIGCKLAAVYRRDILPMYSFS